MPIDTSIYNNIDTQFGQKLGQIFDPTVIAERQNRLSDLANNRSMQQIQMAKGMQDLNKTRDIQAIIKQAGGDPAKIVQALLAAGHTEQAAQLHALIPKPTPTAFSEAAGGFTEPPSAQFPNGRIITPQGFTPKPVKTPDWQDPAFQKYEQDKAKFAAGLKPPADSKPPAGYRFTQNGDLQAIPGGPADIKEQQKNSVQELGRENVSTTIANLRDSYNQLNEGGGITNPNAGTIGNVTAGIASSGLGQATGRMFGTQNQSKRNEILMTRPSLLQHIMKATGMSAKQMDSNAELKLWLSTATDPTLDIAANMKALDNIERTYGVGGRGGQSPQQPPQNTAYDASKEARYQAWKAQQGAR